MDQWEEMRRYLQRLHQQGQAPPTPALPSPPGPPGAMVPNPPQEPYTPPPPPPQSKSVQEMFPELFGKPAPPDPSDKYLRPTEVAPSQQLAPDSSPPPRRIASDPSDRIGPAPVESPDYSQIQPLPKETQVPPDMGDFINRYRQAGQNADKYAFLAGLSRDLAQAGQMASYSGAHIRAGVKPLQAGTSAADAAAGMAARNQQDLLTEESLDPHSATSMRAQAIVKRLVPQLGAQADGMSMRQLAQLFPMIDTYMRTEGMKESRELAQAQKDKLGNRVPTPVATSLDDKRNVISGLEALKAQILKAPGDVGPLMGRLSALEQSVGTSSESQAILNTLSGLHTFQLFRDMGGLRAAGSPTMVDKMKPVAVELQRNPAASLAQIDAIEKLMRTRYNNTLMTMGNDQRDISMHLLGNDVVVKDANGRIVDIRPSGQEGSSESGGWPWIKGPDGKIKQVDPAQVDEILKRPGFTPAKGPNG